MAMPEDLKKELHSIIEAFGTLRFFPKEEGCHIEILKIIMAMCGTAEEVSWLRAAALLAWNDWPGPRDLRALFCTKFRPKDGIEVSLERPIARSFGSDEVARLRALPYQEYLDSDHWRILRNEKLRDAAYRCQLCNSPSDLQVHHRTYENRGREPLSDLVVLCGECHALFHHKSTNQEG